MRVYYRGPRALITADAITVAQSASRSYALSELADVYIIRQQAARGPGGARSMGVSALVGSLVIVPVAGRASVALAAVIFVGLLVCAFVCLRVGPPAHHELVATYRGRRVLVFASDDQREFNQVCRGLQRAREQQR
ncbi:hypothetical protein DMB66_19930 [Actinoplanes sp. ATCC 53533]|uniref:DUF6232 family protein n=1 Tax=Actinoplanes sp. ATCC 53533 TaxID=1288362 RepID=UPI000F7A9C41|nr:DUF6232 family protein [Actinoplanes sp. ATCC 53533]RSM64447.1 hypothetical protein DMB66_19930 [Actinoplanes sp. ATCC 53533]